MRMVTLNPASTTTLGNPSVFYRNKTPTTTAPKCRTIFRPKPLFAAMVEEARPRSLPPVRGSNISNGAVPEANIGVSSIVSSSRNRAEDIQAESKASVSAVNASVYSPELLKFKYASRPFKVML
ncbi:hypothetical protein L1987_09676 [Smallanthus sonchifolius]|uniref:Uncharacterized protein n=1 Tax=Smallanthus sonchifolius TaxID=185202 RepID=A0ACB9JQ22_9ASTR|nr:hypothetical protein L1987_09676 [Smallanthus sonchifolius]